MHQKHYQHLSDAELLQRYQSDADKEWMGILLQRYTLLLLGVCLKYLKVEEEAKDCVQTICLKVIGEAGKYKIDYFKSWLYKVARNECLMRLRSKGIVIKELPDELPLTAEIETDSYDKENTYQRLEAAVALLSPEQQECVLLFYVQKLSYQQVSEKTGYSLLQVKSYLQNGKRNLKLLLEKAGPLQR